MRELDDSQLIEKCKAGDQSAFYELVRRHEESCVSLAYHILGDEQDALDVSQEAFIRAFNAIGKLRDPERFRRWLSRIVVNLCRTALRSKGAVKTFSLSDLEEDQALDGSPSLQSSDNPASPMETEELSAALDEAIQSLPFKLRSVVVLCCVEGLPQREAAQILGCSVGLVKWRLHTARRKLLGKLEDYL